MALTLELLTRPLNIVRTELLFISFTMLLIRIITLVMARIYFHPLKEFPGPSLAAATGWYEFYQDVICKGNYVKRFPKLHKKHGPIIRMAPNLLHVNDPDFYQIVFKNPNAYRKAWYFYGGLGISSSLLMIVDPEQHKIRRNIINPLFSKQSVEKLSPLVHTIVKQALKVAEHTQYEGQALDIQQLYRCITVDVISSCIFGHSQGLTSSKQENSKFIASIDLFADRIMLAKHFPVLSRIALRLPLSWAERIAPGYVQFRKDCAKWIGSVITRREKGVITGDFGMPTVFDLLLEPNEAKGYRTPDMEALIDEAFLFSVAGSDTTAYTLSFATYHVLRHEHVRRRLQGELRAVPRMENGMLDVTKLLALPYLTAVVKESLRIATPAPGILPRVVPPEGVQVQGRYIPGGTVVSISQRVIHFNEDLFPEPNVFRPERWLGDTGKQLEKWNVAFSKGSRGCLGLNLANLEIYACLGEFFSRFDMELYNTDDSSMEWYDQGVAKNRSNVKVLVKQTIC